MVGGLPVDRTPDEVEHCVWSLCMVGGLPLDRIEEITDLRLGAGMASHWQAQDHNWAAAQGGRPAARRGRVRRLAPRTARPRWWRLGAGGRAGESFSGLEHDDPVSRRLLGRVQQPHVSLTAFAAEAADFRHPALPFGRRHVCRAPMNLRNRCLGRVRGHSGHPLLACACLVLRSRPGRQSF